MSDHIYSKFFNESTNSPNKLVCQYIECGKMLPAKNGKYCNLRCCNREHARKQRIQAEERRRKTEIAYTQNPKRCLECQAHIPYSMTLNGPVKFCGHSCAAKYTNRNRSLESRKLQGQKLRANYNKMSLDKPRRPDKIQKEPKYPFRKITWLICPVTGKPYHNVPRCGKGHRQSSPYIKDIKKIYYQLARFKFNVYKMPNYFDIAFLRKHGWYTCPGKKRKYSEKNISGVSRDHLYSVAAGMVYKIHPLILSHPANCSLVLQRDNKHKRETCQITIEELIVKIQHFDNLQHQYSYHQKILQLITENQIYVLDLASLRKLI